MADIWVFAEGRQHMLELLTAARSIARSLPLRITCFAAAADLAGEYLKCGSNRVYVLPSLAEDEPFESHLSVLAQLAKDEDPTVILIGATQRGKEIAARLAVKLDTGVCSSCVAFEVDPATGQLIMERLLFGGAGVQRVVCDTLPQIATILPRAFDAATPIEGEANGAIIELGKGVPSAVTVVRRVPRVREAVDITAARVVVCAGRGIEKQEDLHLARSLAEALGGEVGCSRPIAEELRWLPEDVYLGISGKRIKPDLYIGVGVSGQIQHVAGIRDSKVIVGINRDENAPIFDAADYGIVGDLYEVVPMLIEEVNRALRV